jgi:hypothetical protein
MRKRSDGENVNLYILMDLRVLSILNYEKVGCLLSICLYSVYLYVRMYTPLVYERLEG